MSSRAALLASAAGRRIMRLSEGNMTENTEAGKRQILQAAAIVMVLFVVSRLLGLAREMIIGGRFGTSPDLDAYLAAYRLPDILFQLVAGGALGSAFIPLFAGLLAQGRRRDAWRLASAVINLVMLLLTALALLAGLLAPLLVRQIIAPGFSPAQQALTVQLMRLMLLTPVIFGVSGIVMGVLNSSQHFLLPALAPAVYNLGIIGGALFLAPRLGVEGLAVGVVAGALLHLFVQLPALAHRDGFYAPVLGLRDPHVCEVGRLMLPRVIGLAAVQLNFLVNTILSSHMPAGSLAALNYGFMLMLLPEGVFAQAMATAAFPTFSAQVARGEMDAFRSTVSSTLRAILFLSVPASVGLILLRRPLIEVLLQRGAFDAHSTEAVALALGFYALGLAGHSAVEIMARAFYSLHDTLRPVAVSLGGMVLNIVLSLVLSRPFEAGGLAYGGLALANSIATLLEMAVLLALLAGKTRGLPWRELALSAGRTLLASLAMGLVLWSFLYFLGHMNAWLVAGGGIVVGALAYLGTAAVLRAPEPAAMLRLMRGRQRAGRL
jgi:putative peptidoglycan lipid II flippase